MGPLGFLALAVGALCMYSGFTNEPFVSTVQTIFSGGKPAASKSTGTDGSSPATDGWTAVGGTF